MNMYIYILLAKIIVKECFFIYITIIIYYRNIIIYKKYIIYLMYMHKYYHIIMKSYLTIITNKLNYGKSSSTGRAPICGFG